MISIWLASFPQGSSSRELAAEGTILLVILVTHIQHNLLLYLGNVRALISLCTACIGNCHAGVG